MLTHSLQRVFAPKITIDLLRRYPHAVPETWTSCSR